MLDAMNRFRRMRILVPEPRVGNGDRRIERRLLRLKMRDWEWGRRRIISLVWRLSCLLGRRMLVILRAGRRGVRRRLWRMGVDSGVVRNVIKVGIRLFIGIYPSPMTSSSRNPYTSCNANNRYIMTISVDDHTAQAWFNLFDDIGKKV